MGFRTTLGRQNISYLGEDPIQRHAFLTQAISDPTVFTMPSHKRAAALHLKMIGRKKLQAPWKSLAAGSQPESNTLTMQLSLPQPLQIMSVPEVPRKSPAPCRKQPHGSQDPPRRTKRFSPSSSCGMRRRRCRIPRPSGGIPTFIAIWLHPWWSADTHPGPWNRVKTPIIVWPDVAPEKEQEGQSQLIVLEEEMGTMTLSLKLVQGSQVIS
ncbi:uncharacterized protein LOC142827203 isoform X2 [Pelodiscus sinensis]|uniref:uncharacterized protein LOC142827203 isoform X2 n=1 Tax=Pelodiscus sinensis TaxID=13735 RepID=UPI003F6AC2DF